MCAHYESCKNPEKLKQHFGIDTVPEAAKSDLWPGYLGLFTRRNQSEEARSDDAVSGREALAGSFGLIPHWATDPKIARNTYNARAETVAEKPSFRDAWRLGRKCIIPADAIYEPDWRSGKAVPARIIRADGQPMGIAGLWSAWKSPNGEILRSYTMLTINADTHAFMKQFHKAADEKRMVVILPEDQYDDWLYTPMNQAREFLRPYSAEELEYATR